MSKATERREPWDVNEKELCTRLLALVPRSERDHHRIFPGGQVKAALKEQGVVPDDMDEAITHLIAGQILVNPGDGIFKLRHPVIKRFSNQVPYVSRAPHREA